MAASLARHRGVFLIAFSLVLVAWGATGFYQGLHSGFSGGLYDPQYRVPGVRPGSLADKSGFQAGDRVISVEGMPVERLGMESRWPRAFATRIGQSRRFVVERNGVQVPLDVVYPAPFPAAVNNRIGAALVGLAFLGFGLWGFLSVGTAPALTLAKTGLAAGTGVALGLGPNLGSWNGVQGHVGTASAVLVYILLLRFFVTFPKAKRVSESRLAAWLAIGAWACVVAFLVAELVVHPALYYTTGSVVSPLMLMFGILILAAIVHTLVRTPRAELRASGMYLIFGGFVAALVGAQAAFIPGISLPGWMYSLPIAAIPLAMALAVRKAARRGGRAIEL